MITSSNGNQYLTPDYLSPLPTTLDAKKSPLALLAQTCSQIGADTGGSKPILPSSEKTLKKETLREKSSPGCSSVSSSSSPVGAKSSFKPYESLEEKPRSKTPAKKSGSDQSSPRASPAGSPGKVAAAGVAATAYLQYPGFVPRLKAECRDPYCQLVGKACPTGCGQCSHHAAAAAAFAHAQLAALAAAASAQPYVCSWIAGDASYCGKRFSTSDELLSHLRTHTSDSLLTPPPAHPLLHRTYPTPPLSPLATARYHPYSKPTILPPSLTSSPFPLPPHPGLPPYLSPYSLYGPRLGASHP